MTDDEIIGLYINRDENAIIETSKVYGKYCFSIANNIVKSLEDAEECVNDTYLKVWESIPPNRPQRFRVYIGRITRNLSFNFYKRMKADKRGKGQFAETLEELAECLPGGTEPEKEIDRNELVCSINDFLRGLPSEKRIIFVRRYWYSDSIADIADRCGITQNSVSVILNRLRKQLKKILIERGLK